jgi:hypothetical protein
MPVIAGFAIALSTVLMPAPALDATSTASTTMAATTTAPAVQTVEQYIRTQFADAPIMVDIARCESRFRQKSVDGSVLKNPHSSAMGVFQIMASIHAKPALTNLGLNIYSLEGNAAYARYLYERQGTSPWNDSKACWGKSQYVVRAS